MKSANTHPVGILGILTTILGFACQPTISPALVELVPAHYKELVAGAITFAGVVMAYVGRPVIVP